MTALLKASAQMAATGHGTLPTRRPGTSVPARGKIDFSQSYEIGLAAVLSLPRIKNNRSQGQNVAEEVINVFRDLYEAANGRHVSTPIGPVAFAPAVAPWLKDTALFFETQEQLLDFATSVVGARRVDSEKEL